MVFLLGLDGWRETYRVQPTAIRLKIGPLVCDEGRRELRYQDRAVSLTKSELALLSALGSQPERLLSRQELRDKIWRSGKKVDLRTIDAHIAHIRKKLRQFKLAPSCRPIIQTIWGLGYKLKKSDLASRRPTR